LHFLFQTLIQETLVYLFTVRSFGNLHCFHYQMLFAHIFAKQTFELIEQWLYTRCTALRIHPRTWKVNRDVSVLLHNKQNKECVAMTLLFCARPERDIITFIKVLGKTLYWLLVTLEGAVDMTTKKYAPTYSLFSLLLQISLCPGQSMDDSYAANRDTFRVSWRIKCWGWI